MSQSDIQQREKAWFPHSDTAVTSLKKSKNSQLIRYNTDKNLNSDIFPAVASLC